LAQAILASAGPSPKGASIGPPLGRPERMPDDELNGCRKGAKNGEPTQQHFNALQQQLLCAGINFFHRHIRWDQEVLQRMEGNEMFRLFFEAQYHNKPDLNRIFLESVHDTSMLHVCSFILSILHNGIFSVSAFIVSVIYLSRFKEISHITLHACTWRPLFLTSLLLADKMWEDKPVRNSSLAKLFPVLDNVELNKLESEFLLAIKFNTLVKPDMFCSFCSKLLAEQVHQEITQSVACSEYAATLEEGADPEGNLAPKEANATEAMAASGSHYTAQQHALLAAHQAQPHLSVGQPQQPQQPQQQQQHHQHHQQSDEELARALQAEEDAQAGGGAARARQRQTRPPLGASVHPGSPFEQMLQAVGLVGASAVAGRGQPAAAAVQRPGHGRHGDDAVQQLQEVMLQLNRQLAPQVRQFDSQLRQVNAQLTPQLRQFNAQLQPHLQGVQEQIRRLEAQLQGRTPPGRGASARSIDATTTVTTYERSPSSPEGASGGEGEQCMVCLDNFRAGDQIRILPCMHRFHVFCIDPWLRRNCCCPNCNHRFGPQ